MARYGQRILSFRPVFRRFGLPQRLFLLIGDPLRLLDVGMQGPAD